MSLLLLSETRNMNSLPVTDRRGKYLQVGYTVRAERSNRVGRVVSFGHGWVRVEGMANGRIATVKPTRLEVIAR